METNFTSGQILFIQSVKKYFYISVMRSMQPHPVVDDEDQSDMNKFARHLASKSLRRGLEKEAKQIINESLLELE